MKKIIIFMMMIFFSSLANSQPPKGISKEEAIQKAEAVAVTSNPPMTSNMRTAYAVYMQNENAWIVDFVDKSSKASDYMVRVEASSGRTPRLITGSQKERYRSHFQNTTNP